MKSFIQKHLTADNVLCILAIAIFYALGVWR